jgi:hypothetical protein
VNRQEYLQRVRRVTNDLVRERFVRQDDVEAIVQRADQTWSVIVGR